MRALVVAGAVLGLATVSDGFVYLAVQRRASLPVGFFPLLAVGTAFVYMLLAAPLGRLADRAGRGLVLLAGHLLLVVVYATLLSSAFGVVVVVVSLGLLGAQYAATDGVLAALTSAVLSAHLRTSGLALVATGTALSRLAGSVLFGAVWAAWGLRAAIAGFLVGQLAAVAVAALVLAHHGEVRGRAGRGPGAERCSPRCASPASWSPAARWRWRRCAPAMSRRRRRRSRCGRAWTRPAWKGSRAWCSAAPRWTPTTAESGWCR